MKLSQKKKDMVKYCYLILFESDQINPPIKRMVKHQKKRERFTKTDFCKMIAEDLDVHWRSILRVINELNEE